MARPRHQGVVLGEQPVGLRKHAGGVGLIPFIAIGLAADLAGIGVPALALFPRLIRIQTRGPSEGHLPIVATLQVGPQAEVLPLQTHPGAAGLVLQVAAVPSVDAGVENQIALEVMVHDPTHLLLMHGLARACAHGIGARHPRRAEFVLRQPQRIQGLGHVKQIHDEFVPGPAVAIQGDDGVQLLAPCRAVVTVAVGAERAVVRHHPHLAGARTALPIAASQAIRADMQLGACFGLISRLAREGLDDPA